MSDTSPLVIVGGGQSGLATASAARAAGLTAVVLEAGDRPAGSWPRHYDSLTLFSPAESSSLDGVRMIGDDPDYYPTRDDVADYLVAYAAGLDVDVHTGTRVTGVESLGGRFLVHTAHGDALEAGAVVAASGSFDNPVRPSLTGEHTFTGEILHVADYRNPARFAGKRIVVVGAGNSAVQVGYELGQVATVTLATRRPLAWKPQRYEGKDLHYWMRVLGFDDLPPAWLAQLVSGPLVVDDGKYGRAEADGVFDRRPMFTALDGDSVIWSDTGREQVDVVLLATGYQPNVSYLAGLGALDTDGRPQHAGGISITVPGLGYVGLEFQRSFSSNTLRGVRRDADHVIQAVAAHLHGAQSILSF